MRNKQNMPKKPTRRYTQILTRPKIIAVDFDGCLVTDKYPKIGEPIQETINALLYQQKRGAKIILWTCRAKDKKLAAIDWCTRHGILFDAVNANLPEMIKLYGSDTRKIYADEYWDDKAVQKGDYYER